MQDIIKYLNTKPSNIKICHFDGNRCDPAENALYKKREIVERWTMTCGCMISLADKSAPWLMAP
jgi:hypothetical protein